MLPVDNNKLYLPLEVPTCGSSCQIDVLNSAKVLVVGATQGKAIMLSYTAKPGTIVLRSADSAYPCYTKLA